jgi:hypothetical protein
MPTLGSFFLPTVLLDAFMECSPSVDFVLSNSQGLVWFPPLTAEALRPLQSEPDTAQG